MSYSEYFKKRQYRDEICLEISPNAPKQLVEFVENLHTELDYSLCPDQWVLWVLKRCFDMFEDPAAPIEPLQPDNYIWDLIEWLKKPNAVNKCDDILKDAPRPRIAFKDLLQMAQGECMFDIYMKTAEFAEVGG